MGTRAPKGGLETGDEPEGNQRSSRREAGGEQEKVIPLEVSLRRKILQRLGRMQVKPHAHYVHCTGFSFKSMCLAKEKNSQGPMPADLMSAK